MPPGQYFGRKKHVHCKPLILNLIPLKGHRFRFDVVSCDHIKIFQEFSRVCGVCRPDACASVWKCKLDQVRSIEVCLLFILSNWPDPQYTTCDTWNSTQFAVFTEVKKATEDKCNSQT